MAASFLSGVGWQSSRAALEGVTIRALIVDDHPVVRAGLRTCLARREHLKIVGDAADGEEALRKTRELAPHVQKDTLQVWQHTGRELVYEEGSPGRQDGRGPAQNALPQAPLDRAEGDAQRAGAPLCLGRGIGRRSAAIHRR